MPLLGGEDERVVKQQPRAVTVFSGPGGGGGDDVGSSTDPDDQHGLENGDSRANNTAHQPSSPTSASGSGGHGGQLGLFMLLVEFLDALPEACVIAISILEGEINLSLVLSIAALNFSTGLATFTDLIPNSSGRQPHLLFFSATLAAGMLVFSVSSLYAEFNFEYNNGFRTKFQFGLLMLGTILGGLLVTTLMW